MTKAERNLTTNSTRRLDRMAFMHIYAIHVECCMLGAG